MQRKNIYIYLRHLSKKVNSFPLLSINLSVNHQRDMAEQIIYILYLQNKRKKRGTLF